MILLGIAAGFVVQLLAFSQLTTAWQYEDGKSAS
jgi:hypothetical protein